MYGLSGVWDITLLNNKLRKMKIFRSLKVRIFLIILIVGLIPCFVMRYAILQNYEECKPYDILKLLNHEEDYLRLSMYG